MTSSLSIPYFQSSNIFSKSTFDSSKNRYFTSPFFYCALCLTPGVILPFLPPLQAWASKLTISSNQSHNMLRKITSPSGQKEWRNIPFSIVLLVIRIHVTRILICLKWTSNQLVTYILIFGQSCKKSSQ